MRRSVPAYLRTRCLFVLHRMLGEHWMVRFWPKADIELIPDSRTPSLAFLTCRRCCREGLADERQQAVLPAVQPCAGGNPHSKRMVAARVGSISAQSALHL